MVQKFRKKREDVPVVYAMATVARGCTIIADVKWLREADLTGHHHQ